MQQTCYTDPEITHGGLVMSIGSRIKARREACGLSVIDLAERLGKARSTVYRYESDEVQDMPITVLEPLARALCNCRIHGVRLSETAWTNGKEQMKNALCGFLCAGVLPKSLAERAEMCIIYE